MCHVLPVMAVRCPMFIDWLFWFVWLETFISRGVENGWKWQPLHCFFFHDVPNSIFDVLGNDEICLQVYSRASFSLDSLKKFHQVVDSGISFRRTTPHLSTTIWDPTEKEWLVPHPWPHHLVPRGDIWRHTKTPPMCPSANSLSYGLTCMQRWGVGFLGNF